MYHPFQRMILPMLSIHLLKVAVQSIKRNARKVLSRNLHLRYGAERKRYEQTRSIPCGGAVAGRIAFCVYKRFQLSVKRNIYIHRGVKTGLLHENYTGKRKSPYLWDFFFVFGTPSGGFFYFWKKQKSREKADAACISGKWQESRKTLKSASVTRLLHDFRKLFELRSARDVRIVERLRV